MTETNKILTTKIGNLNQNIKSHDHIGRKFKDKIIDLEMEIERLGIQKDTLETTKDENIKYLKKELGVHQSYALKAIDRNCMTGEDIRSQALENYHIILAHREEIRLLNVEPDKLKLDFRRIKTRYERQLENLQLQLEDNQTSFQQLH